MILGDSLSQEGPYQLSHMRAWYIRATHKESSGCVRQLLGGEGEEEENILLAFYLSDSRKTVVV